MSQLVNKKEQFIAVNIPDQYYIIDHYSCLHDGTLFCLEGFTWNGSNLITNNNRNKRGSMFHDCLYSYFSRKLLSTKYRVTADKMYRDILIEDGTSKVWAWLQYLGIRVLGWMWI